jgi:hypothetical protein
MEVSFAAAAAQAAAQRAGVIVLDNMIGASYELLG